MDTELLEIHPQELKFMFELKKQSSVSIQLLSNSDQYVAFKVKTTSPKKYCVRPNIGVVKPRSTYDFTVTMQAQRTAPSDLQCKDKFLIQSTIVPFGTSEEDITSDMFAKHNGKYIEEKKLRVVLVNPSSSPVLLPVNGVSKQDVSYEISEKDKVLSGTENVPPPKLIFKDEVLNSAKDVDKALQSVEYTDETLKTAKVMDETLKPAKVMDEINAIKDVESRSDDDGEELKLAKVVSDVKLVKDFKDSQSTFDILRSKLSEAEFTITKLTDERNIATQEKEILMQELALLRQKGNVRTVQVGFPFLFVCMVALISLASGYLMHP